MKWGSMALAVALAGCATPGLNNDRLISQGQWTPPAPVGEGRFLIQGFETRDALKGAGEFCAKVGKTIVTEDIKPSTPSARASITFRCG